MRFGYVLLGLVTLTSIHTSSGQCSNGSPGVQVDDVCCAASCGTTCGGGGCGSLPGGPLNCCTSRIRDSGLVCSATQPAPCIIESTSTCSNGIPGVQFGDIYCCDASCGTCGGSGCAGRPGGQDNCCAQRIRASGLMCDTTMVAPCIMNDRTPAPPTVAPTTAPPTTAPPTTAPPTTAPPTTAPPTPGPVCSNGLSGIQSGTTCCNAQCGRCGGGGCGRLLGGGSNCCTGAIASSGRRCSITMQAPCIIDN